MMANVNGTRFPSLAPLAAALSALAALALPAAAAGPAEEAPPIVTIFGDPSLNEASTLDYMMAQQYRECMASAVDALALEHSTRQRLSRASASLGPDASWDHGGGAYPRPGYGMGGRWGYGSRDLDRGFGPGFGAGMGRYGSPSVNYCALASRFAYGQATIRLTDTTLSRAQAAYKAGQYAQAASLFEQAYDKIGYDVAGLMLATMHLKGQGVPRDAAAAVKWYDRVALTASANQVKAPFLLRNPLFAPASVQARVLLANMYVHGDGVPKDPAKARRWYRLADDNDYLPARYVYARMLETGYGGDVDRDKAIRLYRSAAEYGYGPAQYRLAQLHAAGAGVPADMAEARTWFERAAFNPGGGASKARAQTALAELYERGQAVQADPLKALALYRFAAVEGDPHALNALATYFYSGERVAEDKPLSRKLFLEAATRGNPEAMVNGAAMLYKGEGGTQDGVQAYAWLLVAERAGAARARQSLPIVAASLTPEQRAKAEAVLAPAMQAL